MQFQKSSLLMIVENSDSLILLNCVALIFSELFLAEQISLIVEKNASMVLLLIVDFINFPGLIGKFALQFD